MREKKQRNTFGYKCKVACQILILCLVTYICVKGNLSDTTYAASGDSANLRFIFTTDIHGQLDDMDYEIGSPYKIGGLTKAYTLIKNARNEVKSDNYLTFDVGDVLYDYSTEYIFSEDQKRVQPVYQAMSKIGYDAITLGNHDFDYGYDYIVNQLKDSGLFDKTVVSNVYDSITGKPVWKENMIISKKVKTESGKTVTVKVGVIGETIPVLSTKTENYLGVLKTEDIVENVKKQTATLKSKGADIIVVLAHSGFGNEDPDLNYKNVSYAITQIPDVDAILCGHEHKLFPSDDKSSNYYSLPGVDANTNLVNGKVLVMASDRGRSIGVADLKLTISGSGKVSVASRKGETRLVDKDTTLADNYISGFYGDLLSQLLAYTNKDIAKLDNDTTLTSYFGYVQDNASIQLVNDAKISYAQKYVNTKKTEYKDYPVIAATSYCKFGVNSANDYAYITTGGITEAALAQLQPYNRYTALYNITGKQLKEWLEWCASAYETALQEGVSNDSNMSSLVNSAVGKQLIRDEWQNNWSNFYIFDGIEYSINIFNKPRYDFNGNKISESNRITKLTYNGKTVTDNTKFVLATDIITKTTQATKNLDNQAIYKGYNRGQVIVSDYITECNKLGAVNYTADNNWNLIVPYGNKYIVKTSLESVTYAKKMPWYINTELSTQDLAYVSVKGSALNAAVSKPTIILTSTNTETTNNRVKVLVNAYSGVGIKSVRFSYGDYDENSSIWDGATSVVDGGFTVSSNGVISVCATDNKGNRTVKKIKVTNITTSALEAPKVNTYTNRKTKITGTAEPGAIIKFIAETGSYKHVVDSNGKFSYALPSQKSGTTVQVYVEDASGRTSKRTTVKVKRTGPNMGELDKVTNTKLGITGNTRDNDASMIAIIDDIVYVAKKGGKALYQSSEIYDKTLTIKEVSQTINSSLDFKLSIPLQKPGVEVTIYSIDHLGRASRVNKVKVESTGPNKPSINEVMDIERFVTGRVTSTSSKPEFTVYVTVGGKTYSDTTDEKGYYKVYVGKMTVNQIISVYATDKVDNVTRKSYQATRVVGSVDGFLVNNPDNTFFYDDITNKMTSISVYSDPNEEVYISINKKVYEGTTDEDGEYVLDLDDTIKAGTSVYVYTRFANGDVFEVEKMNVVAMPPLTPYTTNKEITTNTTKINMVTDEKCTVVMKIGDKKYTQTKCNYDKSEQGYVYTFTIPRTNSSKTISVYAKNKIGASKSVKMSIVETAPNEPKVDTVKSTSEKIEGSVHLIAPSTLEIYEDVTVSNTETVIYAKIGKKEYKGKIDDNGDFVIKIPKQKKGTVISVWATNKAGGKGPVKKVKVVK